MFHSNGLGVALVGADYASVKNSSFYVPSGLTAGTKAGISITGSSAFGVEGNVFYRLNTGESFGIISDNTANTYPNLISRNTFGAGGQLGPSYSIHATNDNSRLQMLCNDFNNFGQAQNLSTYYSIGLKNASLPNQGSFLEPTANEWDQLFYYQIDVEGSLTPFTYYRYSNASHLPTTNSGAINIFNTNFIFGENTVNTCGANPCENLPWPCELEEIDELETEINQSNVWGLSPGETQQKLRYLEDRQRMTAIELVRKLVLADSGAIAAQRLGLLLPWLPDMAADKAVLDELYTPGGGTLAVETNATAPALRTKRTSTWENITDPDLPKATIYEVLKQLRDQGKNLRLNYLPVKRNSDSAVEQQHAAPAAKSSLVYPNPVKAGNSLHVSLPPCETPYVIIWRDVYGRMWESREVEIVTSGYYVFEVPYNIPSGYYLLSIANNDKGELISTPLIIKD